MKYLLLFTLCRFLALLRPKNHLLPAEVKLSVGSGFSGLSIYGWTKYARASVKEEKQTMMLFAGLQQRASKTQKRIAWFNQIVLTATMSCIDNIDMTSWVETHF